MKKRILIIIPALFLALMALVSSCEKDNEKNYADLMVVHASPDAPGVDLLFDDVKINSAAFTYPNNTGYLKVESGSRNIKINVSGTTNNIINGDLTVEPDKYYSLFAIDLAAKLSVVVLGDDLTPP